MSAMQPSVCFAGPRASYAMSGFAGPRASYAALVER